ncbi:MAG: tail fiber domain-containing protein, partial [Acidobacteria bacterium]|nr:tail fiber domain-containing protein [Acidobacteriota bacterium]
MCERNARINQRVFVLAIAAMLCCAGIASAQTTVFNYQGKLTDAGNPASGTYQLQFKLYDAGGTQIGTTISDIAVTATAGVFTTKLDFGAAAFSGAARFLEISVRHNASEAYTPLSPRQQISSSPDSIRTLSGLQTDDSRKLGGVVSTHYVPTSDARLTDAGTQTSGSASYIQNTMTKQTANFNISGSGTLGGSLTVNGEGTSNIGVSGKGRFIGVDGDSSNGVGVRGKSTGDAGVRGESPTIGVIGVTDRGTAVSASSTSRGSIAVKAYGTSWFYGDTTPLPSTFGTGIAIGSVPSLNYGYIFAIEYPGFSSKVLALNDPGGRVGIGTTTPDQTLTVNGNASKPGGGSWLAFSDERLKNINGRFTTGLRAVMQLQPIRYQYKPNNAFNLNTNGEQYIGFGAQAVQKIIPEAVVKDSKGYLLVNNDAIIWTMLNAVKEQQAQIER